MTATTTELALAEVLTLGAGPCDPALCPHWCTKDHQTRRVPQKRAQGRKQDDPHLPIWQRRKRVREYLRRWMERLRYDPAERLGGALLQAVRLAQGERRRPRPKVRRSALR